MPRCSQAAGPQPLEGLHLQAAKASPQRLQLQVSKVSNNLSHIGLADLSVVLHSYIRLQAKDEQFLHDPPGMPFTRWIDDSAVPVANFSGPA